MMVKYQVFRRKAFKSGKCKCGKHRRRQRTFVMTVNPFNRNPDGSVKTPYEVIEDLRRVSESWRNEPITCEDCDDG